MRPKPGAHRLHESSFVNGNEGSMQLQKRWWERQRCSGGGGGPHRGRCSRVTPCTAMASRSLMSTWPAVPFSARHCPASPAADRTSCAARTHVRAASPPMSHDVGICRCDCGCRGGCAHAEWTHLGALAARLPLIAGAGPAGRPGAAMRGAGNPDEGCLLCPWRAGASGP